MQEGIWAVDSKSIRRVSMPSSAHCQSMFTVLQVDGVTFTFVDLPGIQQWPSADHETSKNLVTSYLTDTSQDTLVLCVIDANTAADLERSAALKEITAAGKISKTILALTKCDEVTDVDAILDKIFDPLADFNSGNIQIPGTSV